jgi:predicted nucleic acid-binding protein
MIRAVLDTSVLIKGIFKPLRSLSKDAYSRELETHEKCKYLIKLIEEKDVEVHVPKICIVETAAVIKRLASRTHAAIVSKGIMKSYDIADEELIFRIAWNVALDTGCSGFDSYFIALAKEKDAVLFTDDSGMHYHAEGAGINSILIRSTDLKTLEQKMQDVFG